MKPDIRRRKIVDILVERGSATLEMLAQHFDVSTMTIHRDLDELEEAGLLRKIRGGATVKSSGRFESDYRYRTRLASEEKRQIAERAAKFIEPGSSVMIDDGSTSQMIAPYLLLKRPLTVITNNLALICELRDESGIELLGLGGNYSAKFNGFFGVLTEAALTDLRADTALISSSAICGSSAFHQDQEVMAVKRRMIASSVNKYLMVDHQKFDRTALHRLSELQTFNGVITTSLLPEQKVSELQLDGITVYFADLEDNANQSTNIRNRKP